MKEGHYTELPQLGLKTDDFWSISFRDFVFNVFPGSWRFVGRLFIAKQPMWIEMQSWTFAIQAKYNTEII